MDDRPRLLCVDDEERVVYGLKLTLRRRFRVETALSGPEALEIMKKSPEPFAVIVSDMRMPRMNGAQFLTEARRIAPDSVRVLLTGQADLESAIAAVNEGQIFRFLTKPCTPEVLLRSLEAAAEQYRLITAEQVLLEKTLKGAINMLGDVLGLVSPAAFGRAARICEYATILGTKLEAPDLWAIEIAAMLSQVAAVTLPTQTIDRLCNGERLTREELAMVARLPEVTDRLLANIPRMETVREILSASHRRFDEAEGELPTGASILKIAIDFDALETRGMIAELALETMRGRKGMYDPAMLEAFLELNAGVAQRAQIREVKLAELLPSYVLAEPLTNKQGNLIFGRGQVMSPALIERIKNIAVDGGVKEPIRVVVKTLEDTQPIAEVRAEAV